MSTGRGRPRKKPKNQATAAIKGYHYVNGVEVRITSNSVSTSVSSIDSHLTRGAVVPKDDQVYARDPTNILGRE